MMFTKVFGLAAIFATAVSALPSGMMVKRNGTAPGGGVTITNNLNQNIYAWSVSNTAGPMLTLNANGGSYSEQWQTNPNGGGISIKMATTPSQADVLQFEYTVSGGTIFWDLSCINMGTSSQFTQYGFAVQPSSSSGSCPSAVCQAGDSQCAAAYLQPSDNAATHGCPLNTGLSLQIGQ